MTASAPQTPRPYVYAPPNDPLNVVHADDHILVLDKPSGLLTVEGKTSDLADCLETRAAAQFKGARVVHRLDKDTSGLIILALTPHALAHIGKQFEKRQTKKTYQALIWGQPQHSDGHIDQPIITDWPNRPKQHICHERGKSAQTDWKIIRRGENARVLLIPHTGRTHQLRVHMAYLGHPILGDNLYAPKAALEASSRMCLHADSLEFRHPIGGKSLHFTSPAPF